MMSPKNDCAPLIQSFITELGEEELLNLDRPILHRKHDEQLKVVFDPIRALMQSEEKPKRKIGFSAKME